MAQPTWTVGDYWDYMVTSPSHPQPGTRRLEMTGTESVSVGGMSYPAFRVRTDGQFVHPPPTRGWITQEGTAWYRTSDLALVKEYLNETDFVPFRGYLEIYYTAAFDPPEDLRWPLAPGAAWTASGWVNQSWIVPGFPTTFRNNVVAMSFVVEPERTVDVPAGSFLTIPVNGSFGGYSNVTDWSPAVGNGVRIQTFIPTSGEIQRLELIGYSHRAAAPVTSLAIGAPSAWNGTYVTSATPLSFSVVDRSGMGIRATTYRVDGGTWADYAATGPFTAGVEGVHAIEWYSVDNAGNVESVKNASLRVDDTPPRTTLSIGDPKYPAARTFVTSATALTLAATDGGAMPVGVASTQFRVDGGAWVPYGSVVMLSGDGPHLLEYQSADWLGNTETTGGRDITVDDTPPATVIAPFIGPWTPDTRFTLGAVDAGSGVARTEYRIDRGGWTAYAGGFAIPAGPHVIGYRSADNLDNQEVENTLAVNVASPPLTLPPPTALVNWKPLVAAVFAAILAAVGAWAAHRRPWKGRAGTTAFLVAFAATSLPFALAEASTGAVSYATGLLSIPPIVGLGTVVDVGLLAVGCGLALHRTRRPQASSSEQRL